jgi:flagellar protein FliS
MSNASENPYLRDAVLTATPEQLQLMLYDGCIRFASQAREAITNKDYETSYDRLTRAQNIVLEMRNGLNFDVNRELCERVAAVYGFLYHKLLDANVHRDVNAIDDALKVLRIERETWQLLVDKVNRVRAGGGTETNAGEGFSEEAEAPAGFSAEG